MSMLILVWKCIKVKLTRKVLLLGELILPLFLMLVYIMIRPSLPVMVLEEGYSKPMAMPSNGMMMTLFSAICNDVTPQPNISSLNDYTFTDSRFYDYYQVYETFMNSSNLRKKAKKLFSQVISTMDSLKEIFHANYQLRIGEVLSIGDSTRDQLLNQSHISIDDYDRFVNKEMLDIRAVLLLRIKYKDFITTDLLQLLNGLENTEDNFVHLFPNSDPTFIKYIYHQLSTNFGIRLLPFITTQVFEKKIKLTEHFTKINQIFSLLSTEIKDFNQDKEFSEIVKRIRETHPETVDTKNIIEFLCSSSTAVITNNQDRKKSGGIFSQIPVNRRDYTPDDTCVRGTIGKTLNAMHHNKYPLAATNIEMGRKVLGFLNEFTKPFSDFISNASQYSDTINDIYCFLSTMTFLNNNTTKNITPETIKIGTYIKNISDIFETLPLKWIPTGFKLVSDEEAISKYFDPITEINDFTEMFSSSTSPFTIGISLNNTYDGPTYKLIYMPYMSPRTYQMYPNELEYLPTSPWSYFYFKFGVIYIQDMIEYSLMKLYIPKSISYIDKFMSSMPRFCTIYDRIVQSFCASLPFFALSGYSLFIISTIRTLIMEKELKTLDMIKIMGTNQFKNLFAWFITFCLMSVITIIPLTIYMKVSKFIVFTNPLIFFSVLFTFCVASFAYCVVIYSLFENANVGSAMGYLIFFLGYVPYPLLIYYNNRVPKILNIISGFSLPIAFGKVCMKISMWEEKRIKVTASNIYVSPYSINDYGLSFYWFMMGLDGLLYIMLSICIIFFRRSNLFARLKNKFRINANSNKSNNRSRSSNDISFTNINTNIRDRRLSGEFLSTLSLNQTNEPNIDDSFVNISHIYKKFSKNENYVLRDVSFGLKKNEITCLLGHNGAGKSTLISIILGQISATSGNILIDGMEATKKDCFTNVGFCPQFNILYGSLTVADHLYFYSRLKKKDINHYIQEDIEEFLDKMDMTNKKNQKINSLSGGMKRKLCISIAFIGNPQLVILDEPTAGIDPYSRRSVWDLISKFKKDKTILLTTHHMDEADILGNNVVFISKGMVVTHGSPFELKKKYGGGLKVTITKETEWAEGQAELFLNEFNNFVADSKLVRCGKKDVVIELQQDAEKTPNFIQLLDHIEFNMEKLHIKEYGMEAPSLEDVFLNLRTHRQSSHDMVIPGQPIYNRDFNDGDRYSRSNLNEFDALMNTDTNNNDENFISEEDSFSEPPQNRIVQLNTNQNDYVGDSYIDRMEKIYNTVTLFMVVLQIRFLRFFRDYRIGICTVMVPAIFIVLSCLIALIDSKLGSEPLLPITISPISKHIPQSIVIGQQNFNKYHSYHPLLEFLGKYYSLNDYNLNENLFPREKVCQADKIYNTSCPADVVNNHMLSNDTYKRFAMSQPYDMCVLVWTDNCTLDSYIMESEFFADRSRPFSISFNNSVSNSYGVKHFSTYMQYNHHLFHSSAMGLNFLNNLIFKQNCIENNANCQNITIRGYIQKLFYEAYDSRNALTTTFKKHMYIGVFLGIGMSFAISAFCIFMVETRVSNLRHLFHIYGMNNWVYIVGNVLFDIVSFMTCICVSLIVFKLTHITSLIGKNSIHTILLFVLYGYATIPQMYILSLLFDSVSSAYIVFCAYNVIVSNIGNMILGVLELNHILSTGEISLINNYLLIVPQHTFVNSIKKIFQNAFINELNTKYPTLKLDAYTNYDFYFTGKPMLAFVISGTIGIIALIIGENLYFYYRRKTNNDSGNYLLYNHPLDVLSRGNEFSNDSSLEHLESDVLEESRTVTSSIFHDFALRVCRLKKVYSGLFKPKVYAVKNVSFHVKRGECFGLLGANGAGKTTTFKMLTGQIGTTSGCISYGDEYEEIKFTNAPFSYCPQFDALDMFLTPIDHIKIFSRLRGYSGNEIKQFCFDLINKYDLKSCANKIVRNLSLGNRRKLMVSLCEIANPTIIYYDEPTAGMDPGARRQIWKAIQRLTKNGTSVILTSHNMDECQILCDRIGIMIEGQFACIGSPQHLTNKFGSGYEIIVKIRNGEMEQVLALFDDFLSYAELKDTHMDTLHFKIANKKCTISHIFKMLIRIAQGSNIESFSVSQTKLEQVFVNLLENR